MTFWANISGVGVDRVPQIHGTRVQGCSWVKEHFSVTVAGLVTLSKLNTTIENIVDA